MLSAFMLFLSSVVVALLAGPDPAIAAITSSLQSILRNTHGSSDYGYPTDITRDILPVSLFAVSYTDKLSVERSAWTMLLTAGPRMFRSLFILISKDTFHDADT
jgi:hypothetical protein